MREYKFRAWDKENESMIYPKGILFDGRVVNFGCGVLEAFEGYEIMQYTGLKDKNGKEIYEGDKLEATLAEGVKGFYDFVEGSDAGVGFVWQGQSYSMSQIFGMNTWTPPRPSSSNPRAESISADISNIIESGTIYNLLMTTRDTNRPPEDNTGFVRAVLEVVGYQH